MKTIQFRCKLLTDVILNVKTATEGNQNTLDFIPGSNFLGIVAARYDKYRGDFQKQLDLFHNGTVRYGDAHPVDAGTMVRSSQIPVSMHYPKLMSIQEKCYIHHAYDRNLDHEGEGGHPQQLKQSRKGFYVFANGEGTAVDTPKSFAIKSAYDSDARRARDSQMYGYESLCKGAEFLFEVETDCDEYEQIIKDSLVGKKQIGRSRTAQYGLVEINLVEDGFHQPESTDKMFKKEGKSYAIVYADSRLIFLDENGEPTFQPTANDFGLEGQVNYQLSQIRTFQYAPWNYKRQTRDADRCGIEKGSVLVVEVADGYQMNGAVSRYVGNFNNEGFGHVIYNPAFLDADISKNGLSITAMKKPNQPETNKNNSTHKVPLSGTPLLAVLAKKQNEANAITTIYGEVNQFVADHQAKFREQQFASQWGAIRSLATKASGYEDLKKKIFSDNANTPDGLDGAYLAHGIAIEKWKEKDRKECLEKFVDYIYTAYHDAYGDITVQAVINLASEMAKICKQS